jgi:hypothetical protein
MTLNRNVEDFFNESEQIAMGTGVLVDGLDFSDDQGRCLSVKVPTFLADHQPPPSTRLYRPGSRPLTDAQRQQRITPYLAHRKALSEAWKAPRSTPMRTPSLALSAPSCWSRTMNGPCSGRAT